MQYQQIIDACFEDKIGTNGLNKAGFEEVIEGAKAAFNDIVKKKSSGSFPLLNILEDDDDLAEIISISENIRDEFDELAVLGTGGSTLNPQSLVALNQPHEGVDKKVYFIDSVDPHTIEYFVKQFDLGSTAFLVTSKSGKTVETLAQFSLFISEFEKQGIPAIGRHFFIISNPGDNPIRRMAGDIGATILDHVPDIGGRFSTFTNVGLIPAVVAGIDIKLLRKGAKDAVEAFVAAEISPPVIGAALALSFMNKGVNINVMMPYADRLSAFASWYRQIWAESLGKNGKGSTPIKAMGSLDQHSQLQLYLDGPKDKFFTIIKFTTNNMGNKVHDIADDELNYLKGKTIGDINASLQQATSDTLVSNNCPLRIIDLKKLDEVTLGELMMHFMLETIITAQLLGINAFDQPAVEEGKLFARKILAG